MPIDISFGQLVVISGVNVNNDIVEASQYAIAYATNNGLLASTSVVLGGLSAETFSFSENVDISKNLELGGSIDLSGGIRLGGALDVSGLSTFDNSMIILGGIRLGKGGLPAVTLDISATDALRIPVGTTGERPTTQEAGQIRYNTTTSQFEGYNQSSSWQGLGGVIDIDQDTKIIAETNPLDDNDEIQIYTAGVERLKVDASGTTNIYGNLDVSGSIRLGKTGTPTVTLDISATDAIRIPVGSNSQRPTDAKGLIRYNTDNSTFEGCDGSNWGSLGGVKDVDGDTYISAERSAGLDDDELKLYTAGFERLKVDACGNVVIDPSGLTSNVVLLDVSGVGAMKIPVGSNSQRPTDAKGLIRYNTDNSTFEGCDGSNWGSLGGVKDVDGDTYISAETSAGANNDEIQIYTAGIERLKVDACW
jgi:hypothetical protein